MRKWIFFSGVICWQLCVAAGTVSSAGTVTAQKPAMPEEAASMPASAVTESEALYLHVAKSYYLPGEILWFKAYLSEADSGRPTAQSSVAYVELLNEQLQSVLQAKVALGVGLSNGGSLYLPGDLPGGTYTLVAYTAAMRDHGAGTFFRREISLLNPYLAMDEDAPWTIPALESVGMTPAGAGGGQPLDITASLSRPTIGQRQKLTLQLQTTLDRQASAANLSVSVYQLSALEARSLAVGGEGLTRERCPMSGQGNILPEQQYHTVTFRLTDKVSKQPFSGKDVFLSIPGLHSRLYTGTTDERGRVRFYVKQMYGMNQLAVRLADGLASDVELISPFYPDHRPDASVRSGAGNASTMKWDDPDTYRQIYAHSLDVQAENSYFSKERAVLNTPVLATLPFFGDDAVIYRLDDYTRFVLMEEVLREYVPEVRLIRRGGRYRFRVRDAAHGQYFNNSPLILLDGIPVTSEDAIVAFDPLKIEKISIVTGRYYLGNGVHDGVVSFSTYEGDLAGFDLDTQVTLIPYEGLQAEREFFSPVHDGSDRRLERLPDSRHLLYWNPYLQTNLRGQTEAAFYTSDVPGDYVVVVEGRTPTGEFGRTLLYFTVL